MAGPKRELWKDRVSGKLGAVELSRGRVVGCYGPLDAKDVAGLRLDDVPLERDRSMLRTLREGREQFVRQDGGEGGG